MSIQFLAALGKLNSNGAFSITYIIITPQYFESHIYTTRKQTKNKHIQPIKHSHPRIYTYNKPFHKYQRQSALLSNRKKNPQIFRGSYFPIFFLF